MRTDEELAALAETSHGRTRKRARDALRQRRIRRAERERLQVRTVPGPRSDKIADLEAWAADRLIVPPGHPLAGDPMRIPPFGAAWLGAANSGSVSESLLTIARKNGKSAIVAVTLLAHLVGPLRQDGWRAGVVSLSGQKAAELRMQVAAIAAASGLDDQLEVRTTPAPGLILGPAGRVDILAADARSGHASGFDLVIIDELGLLLERHRPMVMGLRSSISARDGAVWAISVHGSGPFIPEILSRRDVSGTVVHAHIPADSHPRIDDEDVWREGNPGLGTIKSLDYMRAEARRAAQNPADQPYFRAFDLNCPIHPSSTPLLDVETWRQCECEPDGLPPRTPTCVVGIDPGEPETMAAIAAWWPTGRVEIWAAVAARPPLADRGRAEGVGDLLIRMHARDELLLAPALETPLEHVLPICAGALAGVRVTLAVADTTRQRELRRAVAGAGGAWPWRWVSHHAGGPDWSLGIRAVVGQAAAGRLKVATSLLMRTALAATALHRDGMGQPSLAPATDRGRIHPVRALVLAAFASAVRPAAGGGGMAF